MASHHIQPNSLLGNCDQSKAIIKAIIMSSGLVQFELVDLAAMTNSTQIRRKCHHCNLQTHTERETEFIIHNLLQCFHFSSLLLKSQIITFFQD